MAVPRGRRAQANCRRRAARAGRVSMVARRAGERAWRCPATERGAAGTDGTGGGRAAAPLAKTALGLGKGARRGRVRGRPPLQGHRPKQPGGRMQAAPAQGWSEGICQGQCQSGPRDDSRGFVIWGLGMCAATRGRRPASRRKPPLFSVRKMRSAPRERLSPSVLDVEKVRGPDCSTPALRAIRGP
ncbi:MAG: hypothetical protein J3K34DRAFT_401285 [Monoraphidium minutum]|nr:MAG: hypothetical protein J3K34DRAFT_401285 [Monoraphidium minutum]